MKSLSAGSEGDPIESPPVWVAWIDIRVTRRNGSKPWSPPVWVAWIEIVFKIHKNALHHGATRMGGVD